MPIISRGQLAAALYGIWLLLKLDARALDYFDKTPGGFARSFLPAVVLLPFHLVHASLIYDPEQTKLVFAPYLVVQFLSYVLDCVAFPFVMLYVTRLLSREVRYFWYLVPYNWFQLPVGLVMLVVAILADAGIVPEDMAGYFILFIYTLLFTFGSFIARIGLAIGLFTAIGVVVLDFLLTAMTTELVSRIWA